MTNKKLAKEITATALKFAYAMFVIGLILVILGYLPIHFYLTESESILRYADTSTTIGLTIVFVLFLGVAWFTAAISIHEIASQTLRDLKNEIDYIHTH